MTKQEQEDLCRLLRKLLIDIYHECGDIADCDLGFTIADVRVKTHIKFELGEANE